MKTTESVSMSYRSFCTTKEYLGDTSMRGSRGGRDDLDPLPPPTPGKVYISEITANWSRTPFSSR